MKNEILQKYINLSLIENDSIFENKNFKTESKPPENSELNSIISRLEKVERIALEFPKKEIFEEIQRLKEQKRKIEFELLIQDDNIKLGYSKKHEDRLVWDTSISFVRFEKGAEYSTKELRKLQNCSDWMNDMVHSIKTFFGAIWIEQNINLTKNNN